MSHPQGIEEPPSYPMLHRAREGHGSGGSGGGGHACCDGGTGSCRGGLGCLERLEGWYCLQARGAQRSIGQGGPERREDKEMLLLL